MIRLASILSVPLADTPEVGQHGQTLPAALFWVELSAEDIALLDGRWQAKTIICIGNQGLVILDG
jgi:hypothetical protein